jgi:hypothetical protein
MAEKQHAPLLDEAASAPVGLRVIETKGRGRGLAATRAFRRGEVIECAPVIVVAKHLLQPLRGSVLDDYWFWWDDEHNAFALGRAALHGEPDDPSPVWFRAR